MTRARMGLLLAVAAASVCLLSAAPAQADLTWKPGPPDDPFGQTVSENGSVADFPRVATDGKGDAVEIWRQQTGSTWTIKAAFRSPGVNFGAPVLLETIPAGKTPFAPRVAMDAQGNTVAVWWYGVPSNGDHPLYTINSKYRPAGGSFGALDNVRSPAYLRAPSLAMDAAGNATLLWREETVPDFTTKDVARVANRPAGASAFSGYTTISNESTESVEVQPYQGSEESDDSQMVLKMDPQGRTLAVWRATIGGSQYIRAAYRNTATGTFSSPVSISSGTAFKPSADLDDQGNAIVSWESTGSGTAQYNFRSVSTGTWTTPTGQDLGPINGFVDPQVTFDSQGGALAVWSNGGPVAAYRPAGGSFGSPAPVTPTGGTPYWGRLVSDGSGNAVVTWIADDGQDQRVMTAFRPAGAGATFGTAHQISEPGDMAGPFPPTGSYQGPELAMGANGEAYSVWTRLVGPEFHVEAAVGLPPGAPPPPPPPPPPEPPVPSAIQPAENFKRSQAIVLNVNVTGQADSVRWTFAGKAPAVTGGNVAGGLQKSVRLHPQPGDSFTATATVSGPGGTKSFSRSFTVPRGLNDPDVKRIEGAVDRFSKVDTSAAGFADNLLGKTSSCSPMNVVSGQQKLSGCMKPIEDLPDIPSVERGILDPLAQKLHLPLSDADLMKKAVQYSDGFISQGRALLNDKWPVVPSGAAKLLNYPQASALTSSNASIEVAGAKFGASPRGFSLDLDPKKANIPLGSLPKPPKLPSIGGFELVGDWDMDLGKQEATIKASLKLPKWITSAGIEVQNSVTLRATPTELKVEDVSVGPIKVNLGGLDVQGFKISYTKAEDTWQGQGKACIASGLCLDMVPPNGQVKITHGQLNFAGASIQFPIPGVPLFTGVNLERIGFGVGLDPTRFVGNARIAVLKLVKLDGRIVVAFPSERTPFILRPDEVGDGFPASLNGQRFTRPVIGATAAVIVALPKLELELGHGYFLYHYPSYIAVGGGVRADILDVVGFDGNISGEANFRDEVVNLHGDIHVCLLHPHICGGAVANISRGPNNAGGAGGCLDVGPVSVGGGVKWSGKIIIWPIDGCKWSRFKLDVSATRAQASAPRTIVVKAGQPSPVLKLYGQGGAPRVHVAGPGGQALDTTDKGLDFTPDGKIRILRSEGENFNFTTVGIQNGQPGTYTVTPLPGSVPITRVERATDQPNARVSGRVTGRGGQRVLHYRVLRRDGQSVRFFDVGEGNASKEIGHITGGGTGAIKFSPAPGRVRRRIEAQFELEGVPAERKVVTSFGPPAPGLATPRGLKVVRAKKTGRTTITWRGVAGAKRYELAVTSAKGYQRFVTTRKHRVILKLAKSLSGRVTVRAVDTFRVSRVTAKPLKRLVAPASRFRTPKRCTVGKKKVTCRRA